MSKSDPPKAPPRFDVRILVGYEVKARRDNISLATAADLLRKAFGASMPTTQFVVTVRKQ